MNKSKYIGYHYIKLYRNKSYLPWSLPGLLEEAGPGLYAFEEEEGLFEPDADFDEDIPCFEEEDDDDGAVFKDFRTAGWNSGPTILGFFFSNNSMAAFWASSLFLSASFLFASSSSFFFLSFSVSTAEEGLPLAFPFPARWAGGNLPVFRRWLSLSRSKSSRCFLDMGRSSSNFLFLIWGSCWNKKGTQQPFKFMPRNQNKQLNRICYFTLLSICLQ